MNANGHRAVAIATWLGVAPHDGVTSLWQIGIGAAIAGACSHGKLSPDVDHPLVAPVISQYIPGGHRGITHWFPLSIAIIITANYAGMYRWQVLAIGIAWISHVVADAPTGSVPLWPKIRGWRRIGLGFKTGGSMEKKIAIPVAIGMSVVFIILIVNTVVNAKG